MEPSQQLDPDLRRRLAIRLIYPELPAGTRPVLRVMPEWGVSFPLWTANGVVGPLAPDDLPISEGLKRRLSQWGGEWDRRMEPVLAEKPAPNMSDWEARGHALRRELVEEIGDLVEIRDCYSEGH